MEIAKIIEEYKKGVTLPKIEEYNKQYKVEEHAIFKDLVKYPDRVIISDYVDENNVKKSSSKTVPLVRVGLPYQKKIVSIATTFFCGNPIKYTNSIEDTTLYDAFRKVIEKNKMEFVDRTILDSCGRFTEVAELWYHTDEPNEHYGFKSQFRLKVKVLTPDIYKLYPQFDENENLTSFSREFKIGEKTIFEVYTDTEIIRFENEGEWVQAEKKANPIGKIPIVYRKQEAVEWADVQTAIERLEAIYSNVGESNDRFAFPILGLYGKVTGAMSNSLGGRVLQFEGDGARGEFITQPTANQSLENEINRLERDIHDFTSTPNFSFDNMKSFANVMASDNGNSVFIAPHIKVQDKLSIHLPAFQRRASIIKSYLQMFNATLRNKELEVEAVVTPFRVNNDVEFMKFLMSINGNKPLYSQKHSMEKAGIRNPDEMIAEINSESTKPETETT